MEDQAREMWEQVSSIVPLSRKRIRVDRERLFESARSCVEMLSNHCRAASHLGPPRLEVEFQDEVGTGTGPVMEFFSLVSRSFMLSGAHLWYGDR